MPGKFSKYWYEWPPSNDLNGYRSPFVEFGDRRKVAGGFIVHESLAFRDAAIEN